MFLVNVGMHHGSVLSLVLFAVVKYVVAELAREGVLCKLLYADDLVLINEPILGLRNEFLTLKEAFESMGLEANF